MIKDYFALVFNNLRRRGIRSWLTMLGVFIGIATVVSLISLGAGLQETITGQFSALSVDVLTIQNGETGFGPPGSTAIKRLNENDLEIVESVNDVEIAISRLIRIAGVDFDKERTFEFITNIPKDPDKIEFIYNTFNLRTLEGKLLDENDKRKIVLGSHVAEDHLENKVEIGNKLNIEGKDFEVIGILETSSSIIINSAIFMPEEDMKDVLGIEDEIDLIIARVNDKDNVLKTAEEIEKKFRKDRNLKEGEEDFSVQTPIQSLEGINTILNIINLVVIGIAAISLLVGGIGITNTMYTSVLERTGEIGTMKAIGARNFDILMIFIIESGLVGLVGGIIGAIVGLLLAFGVSIMAENIIGGIDLAVKISYPLVLSAISFSFLLGIFSGILPALQASKLNPVEALRK